ncbi:MAG: hypothetical protein L6Q78_13500 [Bacteroidia bacterium]|nr:hypothetical protein [Bacteroidia bacterium]
MKQGQRWQGKIRLKPKFNEEATHLLPDGWLDFGIYHELHEKVVFESWGHPHFAELTFALRSGIGGLSEVKYLFHYSTNTTNNDQTTFVLDFQHLCLTPSHCIFLCEVSMFFRNVICLKDEDELLDAYSLNLLIEFETQNKLEKVLKRLAQAHQIPTWQLGNSETLLDYQEDEIGWMLMGKANLKYYSTLRFIQRNGEEHNTMFSSKGKRNFTTTSRLFIQREFFDYVLYLDHPQKNEYYTISIDDQIDSFQTFLSDFKGNAIHLEHTLLISGMILIFCRVKIGLTDDEFDFYHCCLSFKSSNLSFQKISEHFLINQPDYWNLQEVEIGYLAK